MQHYEYLEVEVVLGNQGTIKEHIKVFTNKVKFLNRKLS